MFLENDLGSTVSLDGEWQFKLGAAPWRTITVPSAWEANTHDKITEGPAVYRRKFILPHPIAADGSGYVLECDAVSFAATVRVNSHHIGEHIGMWSRFQLDITPCVREGENQIEIEVWKPGESRYKLRESLAGFLPDVATTFGGIWQSVRVREIPDAAIADLRVRARAGGLIHVHGRVVSGESVERMREWCVLVHIAELGVSASLQVARGGRFSGALKLDLPRLWSPGEPGLYAFTVELIDGRAEVVARAARRIGFRKLRAKGSDTFLNGEPIHIRGVLDWGWDEKRLCPTPSRDELLDAFEKARSLGFNLFKLCLFVPNEAAFDAADETGMLLWLELPMWLPSVTPAFRELALREYEAVLRRVHHHPSIAVVSAGCELNADTDAQFLAELRALVRKWLPDVLYCDNSGSGEAYGGVGGAADDFYDYHFYCEPHFFQPLVDHFRRVYRPDKPWIYGEFCDADTLRDFSLLEAKPFWLVDELPCKRDELTWVRDYERRLHEAGVGDGGRALTQVARKQATVLRKFILERTRFEHATGGYVLTGWRDTPIATSGVVDDRGELKFDPQEWRRFNADRVLLVDRERRREWVCGGDRPIYRDPFTWWSDELVEFHLALSNGAGEVRDAVLHYRVVGDDGVLVASGSCVCNSIGAASVSELGVVRLGPFDVGHEMSGLTGLWLEVRLQSGGCVLAENGWRLWIVRRLDAAQLLLSPRLITDFDATLLARVWSGAWFVLWQVSPCVFTHPCSFWREAVHFFVGGFSPGMLFERNAYANLNLYGIATDIALDKARLAQALGIPLEQIQSLWRRFDARAMTWSDYIVEAQVGAGRLIVSTVRFAGGLGQQPRSIEHNPIGAWLLAHLLQMVQA